MNTKSYKVQNDATAAAAEPVADYGRTATMFRSVTSRPDISREDDKKSDWLRDNFERLLSEADRKYGKKKLMTPEEYFGKLKHIVNAYYDSTSHGVAQQEVDIHLSHRRRRCGS